MFTKKQIRVTIALAEGTFDNGENTVILPAVPTRVSVDKTGGNELPKAKITISNLSMSLMERLTFLAFKNLQSLNNVIKIDAGEEGQALSTVFEGEITSAVPVFDVSGSVNFSVDAMSGFFPLQKSAPPVSVNDEISIENLFSQFAAEAGYELENDGVSGSVKQAIFTGSPIQKARQLAKQTGVDLIIDNRRFIILPSYLASRNGDSVPLLRKDTGMIGYPSFTNDGIKAQCLFLPALSVGGLVKIESVVPKASGVWRVTKIHHTLEAYTTSGGAWVSDIDAEWIADK